MDRFLLINLFAFEAVQTLHTSIYDDRCHQHATAACTYKIQFQGALAHGLRSRVQEHTLEMQSYMFHMHAYVNPC